MTKSCITGTIAAVAAICLLVSSASAQCPSNDPYCSFCMGSQCVACNGAILTNGVCSPPAISVSGCIAYNNNGTCSNCGEGYYVTSDNICLPNPINNCAVYTLTGGCTSCFANVRALQNNCANNQTTCNVTNCEVCSNAGVCQGCGRGYVFEASNNTCLAYNQGYYGCLRTSGGVCTACRYGFYYRNGGCTGSSLIDTNNTGTNGTVASAFKNLAGLALTALIALVMN